MYITSIISIWYSILPLNVGKFVFVFITVLVFNLFLNFLFGTLPWVFHHPQFVECWVFLWTYKASHLAKNWIFNSQIDKFLRVFLFDAFMYLMVGGQSGIWVLVTINWRPFAGDSFLATIFLASKLWTKSVILSL